MPEEAIPVAVELAPTNYLDLAWQRLLDNPSHYATSPGGLVTMVLVVGLAVLRYLVRKRG